METVQKAVSMGRALRYQFNLKIRQPLKAVEIVTKNQQEKSVLREMESSIMEELNVKEVIFHDKEDELVEYSAKANFKVLGKELGAKMKTAAAQIERLSSAEIESLFDGATLNLDVDGQSVELTADKVILNRIEKANLKVLNEGTLTIALNTQITEELLLEGYIRDLVRTVQNLRKESGLEVTDRITLSVSGTDPDGKQLLQKAFKANNDYLMNETLAVEAVFGAQLPAGKDSAELDMGDGLCWHIVLEKAEAYL